MRAPVMLTRVLMGLRSKGLFWTLGLSLSLGGLGLLVLTLYLQRSFSAIETEHLREDALRLQAGLAQAVAQRARGAREWSQWTQLRDFVRNRDTDFARSNLSPASLRASRLDWLVVLDREGELIWTASADGSHFDAENLLNRGTPRGQRLFKMPPPGGHCALDRWLGQLVVICQLPIHDSEGGGEPVGILLTGESLDERKLDELRSILGLRFNLLADDPSPTGGSDFEGIAGAQLETGGQQLRLSWPLRVGDEAAHSLLKLDWPREMHTQMQRVLRGAQALLVGVALLLAAALLVVINVHLVHRLRHLQQQLSAVRTSEQWQLRLTVEGHDELAALAAEGNHLLERIEQQMEVLDAQSRTDSLTGLANRRGFEARLQEALTRCNRSGHPLCLVLLDADHFKRFNDEHGHQAGDRALQALALALREVARRGDDLAARWGGEEFALLFEGLPPELAAQRVEALRALLAAQPVGKGQALAADLTVSAGLAQARPQDGPESLLQRADAALYRAKANGRNRLELESA